MAAKKLNDVSEYSICIVFCPQDILKVVKKKVSRKLPHMGLQAILKDELASQGRPSFVQEYFVLQKYT